MASIGRNEPCPCGSGKKYKKCCWQADSGLVVERLASLNAELHAQQRERDELCDQLKQNISELVVELIDAGRLDEAERRCLELRDRFPEDPIGLERLGRLAEARGDANAAASLYREAVQMIDGNLDGYYCDHCRAEIVKAIRRLQPDQPSPPLTLDSA
jgi:tetratricopeptide (TPR) repeat protein